MRSHLDAAARHGGRLSPLLPWSAAVLASVVLCALPPLAGQYSPEPRLPSYVDYPDLKTLIDDSTHVLVARVLAVDAVEGVEFPVTWFPPTPARLLRVALQPLLVAKGTLSERDRSELMVNAYGWRKGDEFSASPEPYDGHPLVVGDGSIRIYFIRQTPDGFRPVVDIVDYTIPVATGRTWTLPDSALASTEAMLAHALMLPGEGDGDRSRLYYSSGALENAIHLVGQKAALEIARLASVRLRGDPSRLYSLCRAAVDVALFGMGECLVFPSGTAPPRPSPALLEWAQTSPYAHEVVVYVRLFAEWEDELLQASRSDSGFAMWLSRFRWSALGRERQKDMLEMFTIHPNMTVRQRAESALRELRR